MAAWDGLPEFIDVANATSKAKRLSYGERIRVEIEKVEAEIRALEQKKSGLIASLVIVEDRSATNLVEEKD